MGSDSPLRVMRVIARLNTGGPAIHVALASAGLKRLGYETRLLAGTVGADEGDMSGFARERGVEVENVPGLGREVRAGGDLAALRHLVRICREFRPHIVHSHTAKAGALARIAGRIWNGRRPADAPRARLVHTFHGHVLRGYFGPVKQGVFRTIERTLARRTDRLVVPSPRLVDELVALRVGRREQYTVIPLGFELEPLLAIAPRDAGSPGGPFRRALGVADGAILAGVVGRITAIKNHSLLLEAIALIKGRTRRDVHLAVIGDGELRAAVTAEAAARGISASVHFAGWQTDLPAVYRDLDVVALSSRNEGTPVALIEGMAAGRTVVSTAVGGVADVVTDSVTGLLVQDGRADRLAVALGLLADDDATRTRLAAAAREAAARTYGVDRLLRDLDALYRSLVENA